MKRSSAYWKRRTLQSEQQASALGFHLSKEYEKAYVRSYNRILREIERLATKGSVSVNNLTRTEIYDYGRLVNLKEIIEKEFTDLTTTMVAGTERTLSKAYVSTLEGAAKDFGIDFIKPNEFQVKAVVNQVYKGSNYSERIWNNNKALGGRIQADMERMIIQGRSPQTISKQLQRDFNVGHSNSDRLIRTEASRVYNEARTESYKRYGIDKVEFLAEPGACSVCAEHGGKVYKLGQGPEIPLHPRCKCAYAPIID